MSKPLRIVCLCLTPLVGIGCVAAKSLAFARPQVAAAGSRLAAQETQAVPVPPDVRPNHWARKAVQEVLQYHILSLPDGHNFHGEAKVTRAQAVIALAKLAQVLEAGKWKPSQSAPVPGKFVVGAQGAGWKQQLVTRYMLASVLARYGDYIANGLHRPGPNDKALGKSEALPPKATVHVPASNPAYPALVYLTGNRMLWSGSPLLTPDNRPLRGAELSQALTQMTAGLTDRLTDLGHDAEGNTYDVNSPKTGKPKR